MPADERSPLLPAVHAASMREAAASGVAPPAPTRTTLSTPVPNSSAGFLTEDDIAIEGIVLALLAELASRSYQLPPGLPTLPADMPQDEADAEIAFLRTVFSVPRHRRVLDRWLPDLSKAAGGAQPGANGTAQHAGGAETPSLVPPAGSILALNRPNPAAAAAARRAPLSTTPSSASTLSVASSSGSSSASTNTIPARPSPLSAQALDPTVVPSPSALFLAGLLSLLVSLQGEYHGSVEETDPGVDGELRMFKARRELGERLYKVVEGLLDSYLLTGDARHHHAHSQDGAVSPDEEDDDDEDALVTLLFHDFPLNYDSMDRATCSLDLLLTLSSAPLVEAENLMSHPVVLASTEYVWRNGLLPPPKRGTRSLTWKESFIRLDRFSIPRILHVQTYILSTLHAAITIYILMFSSYAHFDAFNALAPDAVGIPEGHDHARPVKTWSLLSGLVWWLWVAGTFGWAGEVGRAWFHRGPQASLPLSPSTLLPLLHHALVFVSLLLRIIAFYLATPHHRPSFLLATSLSLLAWSVPFLAASRVLPQNLPSFGTPTHQQWTKIRDGRKRRDVGYRPPPKQVPESHRALRSLEAHLGGLIQFSTYFAVFGLLTLWSLSGEIDYPGAALAVLHAPLALLRTADTSEATATAVKSGSSTPIEARTTLAFTLILGAVLAYFSGGRPSVSPKPAPTSPPSPAVASALASSPSTPRHELDDLDGWDRYGREVAFRARRERLAINRYFTFVPPRSLRAPARVGPGVNRLESLAGAFSTPPLPSPLNLAVPAVLVLGAVVRRVARFRIEQRARWRFVRLPAGRARRGEDDGGEGEGEGGARGVLLTPGQEAERIARRVQEVARLWVWRVGICPLGGWAVAAKGIRRLRGKE
ncbi:hypothetical protein Rhopal_003063-T1 [Rhodotorula paludigena]|uniref:Proteophosphoglycan ppg4 n=1 Tax=Rhodotorula paludigena TaxID=86838 RepID=A0AAV5GBZ4_9BASI|nr:hypothetical protein Rhopal_003063-T1 [Rhodotorula paludigena]